MMTFVCLLYEGNSKKCKVVLFARHEVIRRGGSVTLFIRNMEMSGHLYAAATLPPLRAPSVH
jgi:hypothetical protein